MRRIILLGLALLFAAPARSYDGLTSELAHAAGGMVWGGITAWGVTELWPENRVLIENRALIGFGVATLAGTLGEIHDSRKGYGFSTIDVVASAAGGAIGALVTDRFFLAPVASRSAQGGQYVGVVAQIRF